MVVQQLHYVFSTLTRSLAVLDNNSVALFPCDHRGPVTLALAKELAGITGPFGELAQSRRASTLCARDYRIIYIGFRNNVKSLAPSVAVVSESCKLAKLMFLSEMLK